MEWWLWLVVGMALLGGEMVVPGGFVMLFFGAGALAAGLASGAGFALGVQLGVFGAVSAASMGLLRGRIKATMQHQLGHDDGLGDVLGAVVVVTEDAPATGRGRAEFRGAPWSILNEGFEKLHKGERAKVVGVEGLTLRVTKE